ncbi:MAG TPA: cupredoxin family copper-binding protein [Stellaceae bacterium]|nr:cupredoxin family copper-binding protein [Stellaceae bacterium]
MIMFWLGRRFALAVAAVLLLVGAGLAAAAEHAAVTIGDFAFKQGTITVKRGTTVTWTNKDDEPHTVVSEADPKLWKSPPLDTDDSFSFTFNEAGTFKYFCSVHPRMRGTVVVE